MTDLQPNATSSDYEAMAPYWVMVSTILAGANAMRKAKQYLPKFPNESETDYKFRRENSKFTNIFRDIVENVAAKPFSKEVELTDKATDRIKKLSENITGQGDHLHVFAANCFFHGISYAIDWILVDYTKNVPANATIAQEDALGARPYWVRVPAQNVLAAYSEMIGGVETFVHVRIKEDATVREGYGEKTVERVRVLNRELERNEQGDVISAADATWEVLEKQSVYVLNVVDGCMPSDLGAGSKPELEEERRLLYVAMTRAKDDLHLVLPQRFFTHGQNSQGDRHVYASRTRFIPATLLQYFECMTWPKVRQESAKQVEARNVRVDIAARMRGMWG